VTNLDPKISLKISNRENVIYLRAISFFTLNRKVLQIKLLSVEFYGERSYCSA
jgi:hypothetical protein